MRWNILLLLSAVGFVFSVENKSEPLYKPLVTPEELEFIDNAEIQEILGNLQMFYDQLKREGSTTVKPETSDVNRQYPIHHKEHQPLYTTNKPQTTYRPEQFIKMHPQDEILSHSQLKQIIQENMSQSVIPTMQQKYTAHTQKSQNHAQSPYQKLGFPSSSRQQFQEHILSPKVMYNPETPSFQITKPDHTRHDIHRENEDTMVFHQPQVHYQQPYLKDFHTNVKSPYVVQPAKKPTQSPRQEIEIEYQYQPQARVIGHLTEDQQVRLYKSNSPDSNKISKNPRYEDKGYKRFHNHHEGHEISEHQMETLKNQHYQSQGAKVELVDEQNKDHIVLNNGPGFHLDENERNYYIETLK